MLINIDLERMLKIFNDEVNKMYFLAMKDSPNYFYYSLLNSDMKYSFETTKEKEYLRENPTLSLNDLFKEWREQHNDIEHMDLIYKGLRFILRDRYIDLNPDQKVFKIEPENKILLNCIKLVASMRFIEPESLLNEDIFISHNKAKEICKEIKKDPYIRNILEKLIIKNIYGKYKSVDFLYRRKEELFENKKDIFIEDGDHSTLNIFLHAIILENLFDIDFNLPRNRDILYRKYGLVKEENEYKKMNIIKQNGFNIHYLKDIDNPYVNIEYEYNKFLAIAILSYYVNKNFMYDINWGTLTEKDYADMKKSINSFLYYDDKNKKEIQNFRNYLETLNDDEIKILSYIIDECLLELDI